MMGQPAKGFMGFYSVIKVEESTTRFSYELMRRGDGLCVIVP